MKKLIVFLLVALTFSCGKIGEKKMDRFPEGKDKKYITTEGINVPDADLEISLFAAEPMLFNPTNMDIDHKGRVWICEAYNYRNDVNNVPYEKKGDKILILEDKDGDGKADTSMVFYQGEDINAALGICVLGNKVIVSASPNIFVFTDENGDDIPDKKEILFKTKGGIQSDHGAHSIVFGPDGKLYFSFGNHGIELQDNEGNPLKDIYGRVIGQTLDPYQDGMAFRCDTDGKNIEVLGWNFRNNYELAIDSYGRIWQSDNDDDGVRSNRINYLMPYGNYGYKDEMTGADWRVYRTHMEDSLYQQHWHQNDPGVVPNLFIIGAGSPTGILVYEGDLLPSGYKGDIILGDAVNNDITAYKIIKEGAGYKVRGSRILDASQKDQWFRPSDVTVAPDGSLFVADWYDVGVGGHFIGDLEKGRIYRVTPRGFKGYKTPGFNFNDLASCIEGLKNPSNSVRYLAFEGLKKLGKQAEKELYQLAKGDDPVFAARSLWLLKDIDSKYLEEFSESSNEDIRAATVRMTKREDHSVSFRRMSQDPSYQVKQAVATQINSTNNSEAWLNLAKAYKAGDRWFLEALGIGAYQHWDEYLDLYLKDRNWLKDEAAQEIIWRSRSKKTSEYLARIIRTLPFEQTLKYYRAFDFQGAAERNVALLGLLESSKTEQEKVLIFKQFDASTITQNEKFQNLIPGVLAGIKNDRDFLDIVSKYNLKSERDRVLDILDNENNPAVYGQAADVSVQLFGVNVLLDAIKSKPLNAELAAKRIERIGLVDNEPVTRQLILIFTNKKYPFELREKAILAMEGYLSDVKLWDLVKVNKVSKELMPAAIQVLRKTFHNDIKVEFEHHFGKPDENISVKMPDFENITGDRLNGEKIFDSYCSVCHKVGEKGADFGPGLTNIGSKLTKGALFNGIVYPNQGISLGYETTKMNLKNGTTLTGIVTSKSAEGYWVKIVGESDLRLIRASEVTSVEVLKNQSLMPSFPLGEKEMVDLIDYLSGLK